MSLFDVVARGDPSTLGAFFRAHPEVDVNEGRQLDQWTALHLAAASGNVAMCRSLVGWGASTNARSSAGETPLFLSAAKGHVAAFAFLVAHGSPEPCSCCAPDLVAERACASCRHAKHLVDSAAPDMRRSTSFRSFAERVAGVRSGNTRSTIDVPDAQVSWFASSISTVCTAAPVIPSVPRLRFKCSRVTRLYISLRGVAMRTSSLRY
jgi:hypothetical protein